MKYGWLRVLNPPHGSPDRYNLEHRSKFTNIIGRKVNIPPPDVSIALDTKDKSISRRHFAIKIMLNPKWNYLISDLGSQGGTKLYKRNNPNDFIQLEEEDIVFLQEEDVIEIGSLKLQLQLPVAQDKKESD